MTSRSNPYENVDTTLAQSLKLFNFITGNTEREDFGTCRGLSLETILNLIALSYN